jgi:hypothetical protein
MTESLPVSQYQPPSPFAPVSAHGGSCVLLGTVYTMRAEVKTAGLDWSDTEVSFDTVARVTCAVPQAVASRATAKHTAIR